MITISCSAPKVFTGEHFNFFKKIWNWIFTWLELNLIGINADLAQPAQVLPICYQTDEILATNQFTASF